VEILGCFAKLYAIEKEDVGKTKREGCKGI
jgi:hypothetical protein